MQLVLPVNPPEARPVNGLVAIQIADDQVAYFAGGIPLFTHAIEDIAGARVAGCQLVTLGLAKQKEVADLFDWDRTTLYRQQQKLAEEGVAGLVEAPRGPKGAHKLVGDLVLQAQGLLEGGYSLRKTAARVGVSEGTIRYALKQGTLSRPASGGSGAVVSVLAQEQPTEEPGGAGQEDSIPRGEDSIPGGEDSSITPTEAEVFLVSPCEEEPPVAVVSPSERAERALQSEAGVGVQRHEERLLTSLGVLEEAEPVFEPLEAVQNAGAFVALPALLAQGLLESGKGVYGKLRNGFYGLQSVLLTLVFMAVLRIRNPERLQYHPPAELGVLLGLDRFPEVKTLRRKIDELAQHKQAAVFSRHLSEQWVKESSETVGFLYVDGHVRPYHGHKHDLPETFVARRRLCMDATTDFRVNDLHGDPVLVITAEANDSLLAMLRGEILPQVRELVGERAVTVVFDREGANSQSSRSPKFFRETVAQGFHVLTYRKGKQEPWPTDCFYDVEAKMEGKPVRYKLAQRSVRVEKGFWMREIRRLCDSGHQTSILTSRQDAAEIELAYRMFSRWRQENFFRYMREHFALDALVNYETEAADPKRLVPNPQKKAAQAKVTAVIKQLEKLEREYAQQPLGTCKVKGRKRKGCGATAESQAQEIAAYGQKIAALREQQEALQHEARSLPSRVPVEEVLGADQVVRLSPEAKHLTDTIKMVAYRAETALTQLLMPHYARSEQEGRALVREILQTSADVLPDPKTPTLHIRLHPLANPRSQRAMQALCEELNKTQTLYPNTQRQLVYETIGVA